MIKTKKTYEVPAITVTELETEDIMLISGLIGHDLLTGGGALNHGTINWIDIDLN